MPRTLILRGVNWKKKLKVLARPMIKAKPLRKSTCRNGKRQPRQSKAVQGRGPPRAVTDVAHGQEPPIEEEQHAQEEKQKAKARQPYPNLCQPARQPPAPPSVATACGGCQVPTLQLTLQVRQLQHGAGGASNTLLNPASAPLSHAVVAAHAASPPRRRTLALEAGLECLAHVSVELEID